MEAKILLKKLEGMGWTNEENHMSIGQFCFPHLNTQNLSVYVHLTKMIMGLEISLMVCWARIDVYRTLLSKRSLMSQPKTSKTTNLLLKLQSKGFA